MYNSELIEILDFFRKNKDFLKEEFGLIEIGLFGSLTTGEQNKKSDIDIIIEMEGDKKNLHNFLKLKKLLRRKLGRKVDIGFKGATKKVVWDEMKDKIIYV